MNSLQQQFNKIRWWCVVDAVITWSGLILGVALGLYSILFALQCRNLGYAIGGGVGSFAVTLALIPAWDKTSRGLILSLIGSILLLLLICLMTVFQFD